MFDSFVMNAYNQIINAQLSYLLTFALCYIVCAYILS